MTTAVLEAAAGNLSDVKNLDVDGCGWMKLDDVGCGWISTSIHLHLLIYTLLAFLVVSESMHKLLRWLSVYPQASWGTTVAETCTTVLGVNIVNCDRGRQDGSRGGSGAFPSLF